MYGSSLRIAGALAASTTALWRKWRFCLRVLQLSWWRAYPLRRTILPDPVFLKRLAAPRLVFSFGMIGSSMMRLGGTAMGDFVRELMNEGVEPDVVAAAPGPAPPPPAD